jgi:hypothetical protein
MAKEMLGLAYEVSLLYSQYATNLRDVTDGFTSPPKEVMPLTFIALKIQSSSVRYEPTKIGSNGKHATTRTLRATPWFHTRIWWISNRPVGC